jgi:hypothetical protein
VIEVWKDPLAFCFAVDRDGVPAGFVFGSSAIADGRPAFVLNGLYLRRRDAALRVAVMRAIEWALAPYGVRRLGIARAHGGYGPLPDDYVQRPVVVERLRALEVAGRPVQLAWDDVRTRFNVAEPTTQLYWRDY